MGSLAYKMAEMVGGRGKDPLCCDKGECLKQNSVCRGKQSSKPHQLQEKSRSKPLQSQWVAVKGGSGVAETGCCCERKKVCLYLDIFQFPG